MLEIVVDGQVEAKEIAQLRGSIGWRSLEDKFERGIKNTYLHLTVRDKNGKLIAFLRVISDGVIHAYIADFVVHPEYQRKGIGTRMIDMVIKILKKKEIEFIELTFKEDNLEFYKKTGFEIYYSGQIKK
jgi:ribosomal protein S18 acetylase RimI-like enzyme